MKKLLLFIYLTPFIFSIPVGLAYNDTSSMPRGWYLLFTPQNIAIGDTVLACAPVNKYSAEGIKRKYIERVKNGKCIDGTKYLVKEIASLPYDEVDLTPNGIIVNGKSTNYRVVSYIYVKAGKSDIKLPVKHYPFGKYKIDGYFLISARRKLSYDSRYFGPVKNIVYKAVFLGKDV